MSERSHEEGDDRPTGGASNEAREEDERAAGERVRHMQQEGRGMGGTATDGRMDLPDEDEITGESQGRDA